jgi:alpha-D-xyloside xylohydrolase
LWSAFLFDGSSPLGCPADLSVGHDELTIPLYVRSGSILPTGPDITYADERLNAPLDLRIYPGQDGSFTLYDDEGDNYNYEHGHFAMIRLSWDETNRRLTLYERQGDFPGMPVSREFRIVMGDRSHDDLLSETLPARTVLYEGRKIIIDL